MFRLFYEASILLAPALKEERKSEEEREEGRRFGQVYFSIVSQKTDAERERSVARADTSFMDDIKLHSRILCEHGTGAYASRRYYNV